MQERAEKPGLCRDVLFVQKQISEGELSVCRNLHQNIDHSGLSALYNGMSYAQRKTHVLAFVLMSRDSIAGSYGAKKPQNTNCHRCCFN